MTKALLDEFAMAALTGIIGKAAGESIPPDLLANAAYNMGAAMLAEKQKRCEHGNWKPGDECQLCGAIVEEPGA